MQGDFSRGQRPDRKRGKAYRRVLLQQGRPLLDSDFNALADAGDRLLRELTRDVGAEAGSPDGGFLITAGKLLARFDSLDHVQSSEQLFQARLDYRHKFRDRFPALYLDATRGPGEVAISLTGAAQKLRIWARPLGLPEVYVGSSTWWSLPDSGVPGPGLDDFRAYDLTLDEAMSTLRLRLPAGGAPEAWVGFVEGFDEGGADPGFWITGGRYHVNGIPVSCAETRVTHTGVPAGTYVAFLEGWERHVTRVEDPGLLEPALGGAVDTCTRVEAMGQVKLAQMNPVPSGLFSPQSLADLRAAFERGATSLAQLCVNVQGADTAGPDASLASGFTGSENRLYRFEVHQGGALGAARIKWSRNNGSDLFPVLTVLDGNTLSLPLSSDVQDGDLVELLTDEIDLGDESMASIGPKLVFTPPTRKVGALYYVRERQVDVTDKQVHLLDPETYEQVTLDADFLSQTGKKVRRWHGYFQTKVSGGPASVLLQELEDGLQLQLSGTFSVGEYWQYEARRAQAGGASMALSPPDGPERVYTPLALLRHDPRKQPAIEVHQWLDKRFYPLGQLNADSFGYDGTASRTTANSVQEALDELFDRAQGTCGDATFEADKHGQDDGARLMQLLAQQIPVGGVVCLVSGVFHLKSTVVVGHALEARGCPDAIIVHEVSEGPAFRVGKDARLSLKDVTVVAGAGSGMDLISLASDCEGFSAARCTLIHAQGGIALRSSVSPPVLPDRSPPDTRGWDGSFTGTGPAIQLEECTIVAGWAIAADDLRALSVRDSVVLCTGSAVAAKELSGLELQGVYVDTGLDAATLGGWAEAAPESQAGLARRYLAEHPAAARASGTAVYAERLGDGRVTGSTLACDMGIWAGAAARVHLECNRYLVHDTAIRMDSAAGTSVVAEWILSQKLGVYVPVSGRDVRIQASTIAADSVGVQLGGDYSDEAPVEIEMWNVELSGNVVRADAGTGISAGVPFSGETAYVLQIAHNRLEGALPLKLNGSGFEVLRNDLHCGGTHAVLLSSVANLVMEGNVLHLASGTEGFSLTQVDNASFIGNTVLCQDDGKPVAATGANTIAFERNDFRLGSLRLQQVQGLDFRANYVGGNLVVEESGNGVISENRIEGAEGADSLRITGATERWQVNNNFAARAIRLLPQVGSDVMEPLRSLGMTEQAMVTEVEAEVRGILSDLARDGSTEGVAAAFAVVGTEVEIDVQVSGNWSNELQVGYMSTLASEDAGPDLDRAAAHPYSIVQVIGNRAEERLIVNHYESFIIAHNVMSVALYLDQSSQNRRISGPNLVLS